MKKLHSEWQETPPEALPPSYFIRIEGGGRRLTGACGADGPREAYQARTRAPSAESTSRPTWGHNASDRNALWRPATRDVRHRATGERATSSSIEIEGQRAMARLHAPGDGWRYLSSRAAYLHNGSYWFASLATSEGRILAGRARSATLRDAKLMFADLEAVNYHSLPPRR